ncbi:hypothetical protein GCM10011325_35320 [Dyadobacter sediminis]|nr:hypothetical protein GCM10011325_35320 [Dyadobacter sediminis]
MQLVENTYENPRNMIFTEILNNKIWNVELESGAKRYSSMLSPDHILVAYRLAGTVVPDSLKNLLNTSVIAGGTFSDFREQEYHLFDNADFEKTYLADYLWKGSSYLLKWRATALRGQATTYTLEMASVHARFPAAGLSDLPEALQQYVQDKKFQFSRAIISISARSEKSYQLYLRKNNIDFQLLFDQDCKLLAGSDQPVDLGNAGELPSNIKTYLDSRDEYKGFGFLGNLSGIIRNELDGVKSYVVGIQKQDGSIARNQVWYITFDQNGSPLSRDYFVLY